MKQNWILLNKILIKFVYIFIVFLLLTQISFAKEISLQTAQLVANNFLIKHTTNFGSWNGSTPSLNSCKEIIYKDKLVAYNCQVKPTGHIIIPNNDNVSPVYLYSQKSSFNVLQVSNPNSIESWIIPELYSAYNYFANDSNAGSRSLSKSQTRIKTAWNLLTEQEIATTLKRSSNFRAASKGPLLTTTWDQGAYYYDQTPSKTGCTHALAGCVAVAWAQIMNYWDWPTSGTGSKTYTETDGDIHTADFNHTYDWTNMPTKLISSSSSAQVSAVSQLIADLGIAAETEYGCLSSSSEIFANDVLDVYFKYNNTMQKLQRKNYTAANWFNNIKNEIDASPARPVVLSIFTYPNDNEGHEAIVDGYQTGTTDKVHINMGFSGSYDGYYDITVNFSAISKTWDGTNKQFIVIGIEPNSGVPVVATTAISSITETSATSGGHVTDEGNSSTTARGICWGTSSNPTISDNKTTNSSGLGTYSSSITGLSKNTTYHVRAYATNSTGTGYGEDVSFITSNGSGDEGGGGCFILTVY